MLWLTRLAARARALVSRRTSSRDLDDELRFHVDRQTEENVRGGMSPEIARREALRLFGGVQRYKEELRDEHRSAFVEQLRQDLAYALRAALRNPGFTAVVILTLGLGVGATTAIFSVVRGVILRELPFGAPDRLVRMWIANPTRDESRSAISVPDFDDWQRLGTSFDRMASYSTVPTGLALVDGGEPVRLSTAFVSAGFFSTLGVTARIGRTMLPAEHVPGRDRVVVLSHRLWATRYASNPAIVNTTLHLSDEPYTVIGVMAPEVRFPERETEIWVPHSVVPESGIPRVRGNRWLQVIARLGPGVTPERARIEMAGVAKRLAADFGDTNSGWDAVTLVPLREELLGASRARVLVLFGAVLLTLVLACVNVANLVLARSSRRSRELAVRTALGAGRARLARQLFTESIALALAGGAFGVGLAVWGVRGLVSLIGPWMPAVGDARIDAGVLAFALGVSALTGVVFGLIPLVGRRHDVSGTLRESGRGNTATGRSQSLRRALVGIEVALAMVLVIGAGLLVKSFARLNQVELGFDAERTLFVRMTIPASRYATSADYLPVAYRMLEQVRAVPGVVTAALAKDGPMRAAGEASSFTIPGRDVGGTAAEPRARLLPASDDIVRALGMRLEAGRDLSEQDGGNVIRLAPHFSPSSDSGAIGVVITSTLAKRHWPTRSPVGEEIMFGARRVRIVGVAADARYESVQGEPPPLIFIPYRTMSRRIFTVIARTNGDPATVLPAVRDAIRAVEPDQPITEIGTMRNAVGDAVAAPRVLTLLVGMFGIVALLLAAIGVYGVVAYVVGQRTNEIGIRIALGAQSSNIVGWTLRTGLVPAVVGLVVGGVGALALSRLLGAQLYEVSPNDPIVFGAVGLVLIAVALMASGIPARRAARVDPAVALRVE